MSERLIKPNKGFLVRTWGDTYEPSEAHEYPVKVTDTLNLLNEMGILREGRAWLRLSASGSIGKRTGGRPKVYTIALSDELVLFSLIVFADQAMFVDLGNRKTSVDEFTGSLVKQAKDAYSESELKLNKNRLGLYSILRCVFTREEMSNADAVEVAELDMPLSNVIPLWQSGATLDVIKDTGDLPESWLAKLLA